MLSGRYALCAAESESLDGVRAALGASLLARAVGERLATRLELLHDAAARVLDPVFDGVRTGRPVFGVFLKDYAESEW